MSIKDALASSGAKTAKFENVGDFVEGNVISAEVKRSTDMDGNVRTFPDGSEQTNLVFVLQTNIIDPSIENDNGERSVWLKNWGDDKRAVIQAVKNANDDDVHPGSYLKVTFTSTVPPKNPRHQPRKVYAVEYRPAPGAVGQAIAEENQQAQQSQGQQWGQNPQQGQPQFQNQGQPQQGQPQFQNQGQPQQGSPWGNQQVQQVQPQQGQRNQPQQGSNDPWGNQSQQGQQGNGGLDFS